MLFSTLVENDSGVKSSAGASLSIKNGKVDKESIDCLKTGNEAESKGHVVERAPLTEILPHCKSGNE